MMSLMQQKVPSQSSDWQALMRLRTLSPALGTAYTTEQAPQCLVSILYFRSAIQDIFHKIKPCLVFIHRESSLVCHMYNDIKLTIITARLVVIWYSMPPMYIYCHHSFHEELYKFKHHFQWHMCQCHFQQLCCQGHVGQQIQYTDWQNTAWRIQLVLTTDLNLECAFVNIQIVCYDDFFSENHPQKQRCPELTSDLYAGSYYGGGGDTGVPISHIPDFLPPNIPYPRFFTPNIPYPRFVTPQYPISQISQSIYHIPDFVRL